MTCVIDPARYDLCAGFVNSWSEMLSRAKPARKRWMGQAYLKQLADFSELQLPLARTRLILFQSDLRDAAFIIRADSL